MRANDGVRLVSKVSRDIFIRVQTKTSSQDNPLEDYRWKKKNVMAGQSSEQSAVFYDFPLGLQESLCTGQSFDWQELQQ